MKWFEVYFFKTVLFPRVSAGMCVVCGVDQCLVSNFKADHF